MKMQRIISIIIIALLYFNMAFAQDVTFHFTDGIYNATLKSRMERNASALLTEINAASEQGRSLHLDGLTTSEAARRLNNLWDNFAFVCQSNPKSICYGLVNGYQARGIQTTITRQPEDCTDPTNRELTISFDRDGNISRVGFALLNNHLSASKGESQVDDVRRRNEILKFVEDFRNYYNEKDLTSLKQVYSDDALIITGRVETRKESGDFNNKMRRKTHYTVQDKEGYLANLATLFKNNSYIDVQFNDIMISPANSEAMKNYYGVNLVQHWKSKSKSGKVYEDTGYLFLLWDFNEDPPVIHVRAWQPQNISDDEFIMVDDFR